MKSLSDASACLRVTGHAKDSIDPGRSGRTRFIAARTSRVISSSLKLLGMRGFGFGPCFPNGSRFSLSKFHVSPVGLALLPEPSMR